MRFIKTYLQKTFANNLKKLEKGFNKTKFNNSEDYQNDFIEAHFIIPLKL